MQNSDKINMRRAAAEELATVNAITDAAYQPYVPLFGYKPRPMETDYQPMIADGGVWLLEFDGAAAGVIVLVDEGDRLLIDNVAVMPQYQKRGFGRLLLDWAEQQARAAGYGLIRLYTNALMSSNIALYGRIGYVETGREILPDATVVHMEKRLGSRFGSRFD